MSENNHEGMKKCTKCGEWKPATAEYFPPKRGGLGSWCRECLKVVNREYRQKNKDKVNEYYHEYYRQNKDKVAERNHEYYQKNKDRIREYKQTPVGRLVRSIGYLREKTGATIYVRDMTEEQKETLASQRIAVQTLEKTEKELLAASGKKRCSACDRVLDYGCFNKHAAWCKACVAKYGRKYRQKNKDKVNEHKRKYYEKNKDKLNEYNREYQQKNRDKMKEYWREYYQRNKDKIKDYHREYYKKNKKALDKVKSIPDNRE